MGRPKQLLSFGGKSLLVRAAGSGSGRPGLADRHRAGSAGGENPAGAGPAAGPGDRKPRLDRGGWPRPSAPASAPCSSFRGPGRDRDRALRPAGLFLSGRGRKAPGRPTGERPEHRGGALRRTPGGAGSFSAPGHFPALAALTGDEGARVILQAAAGEVAAVDLLPDLAVDLDTPEDYAALRGASPPPPS